LPIIHLARKGLKVALLEKRLAPGGDIWGGGMGMNVAVVQEQAVGVLEKLGIQCTSARAGLYAVDAVELAAGREEILAMLRRRPCSVEDVADGLGMHRNEVIKYIEELSAENLLDQSLIADRLYYKVAKEMPI